MQISDVFHAAAGVVNRGATALITSPRWGRIVGRGLTEIRYTGRRSGRTVALPVGYRRRGSDILIGVAMPDGKTWWRNFVGAGAPLTILLGGTERPGHAVATRDERGRVTVTVRLDS
ncbi:hypothetical protein H7J51_01990 [Mycobacterium crocinum]|uniref:Nitroreductase n=1 Tax=Mycolicibacterium crocinum TaxID=388459 RepID=A0ABY3TFC0_9MYCO|nr:hypothetical protein [Mycolicibacterium crocinum]MCV7214051.1 hypothetical protein [Mycolicibacterium crocinum]ULN39399.1 hypothetical protein MI149_16715 [Mycolicibacterium crocinum]